MRLVSYRSDEVVGVGVMTNDREFIELPKVAPELPNKLIDILGIPYGIEQVKKAVEGQEATACFCLLYTSDAADD